MTDEPTLPAVAGPLDGPVGPHARKMRQTSEDNYIGDGDGDYRMQREYGLTPNGNSIGGRWVLRGPAEDWIDCDQYRHDLLARHGFVTAQLLR